MESESIQPYFIEQIVGLDWDSGVSRDDVADALDDIPTFQAIVIENLDEDATFGTIDEVIIAIPDDAWQAAASDLQDQGVDLSGIGLDIDTDSSAMGTADGGDSGAMATGSAPSTGDMGANMPPPGAESAETQDQSSAGA